MVTDAVTHEQDIRGALDAPGGRDCDALDGAFRWGAQVLDGSEPRFAARRRCNGRCS
jgi:hypothetical protein